ncbi:MAG: hypothetical protein KA190_15565 [Kofleriaceae bacterium]|nr:hypothetical protein [Kofleriaceae bacterium]
MPHAPRSVLATIASLLLWSCGTTPAPAPGPGTTPATTSAGDTCAVDADCVVTNFAGCCACPQCAVVDPRPRSRAALAAEQAACPSPCPFSMVCATGGMCPPGEPSDHFVARCQAAVCAAVRP